jgi:hypothetical protein
MKQQENSLIPRASIAQVPMAAIAVVPEAIAESHFVSLIL